MPIKIRNKNSQDDRDKLEWIKTLRVGDEICDCRMQHIRISRIEDDLVVQMPGWVRAIIFASWLPFVLGNLLDDIYCWVSRKVGYVELVDRSLLLEDGAYCSAIHCCNPPDHIHSDSADE